MLRGLLRGGLLLSSLLGCVDAGHCGELFYGEVVVPPAVLLEMRHPDAPVEVRTWTEFSPIWLREVFVQHVDESLDVALGAGEREAISLALELHADVLLIDEFLGRQQAEARCIDVTGTLTILLQAAYVWI